jgi:hypothetical protein
MPCCRLLCCACQVVKLGDATPTFTVFPMPGARRVHVPIFATEASTASHVTERGMQDMGVIEVRATAHSHRVACNVATAYPWPAASRHAPVSDPRVHVT